MTWTWISHVPTVADMTLLREHAIGMVTTRMSTRAVSRELDVYFSTISRIQLNFRFADVNFANRVPHGGGRVMVWTGISYGQWTQLNFINGNLKKAQRYSDEILRPIVVPFICRHHLMFQHDNAWPYVARICTLFLEAENVPALPRPAYSPEMSLIEQVWNALNRRVQQGCSSSRQYPTTSHSHWRGVGEHSTGHNATMPHCMRQMVGTPDTDWFSEPCHDFFVNVSVTNRSVFLLMWNP